MDFLRELFSLVCGQNHTWAVGGELLPFCQRCTGLYAGGALAGFFSLLFRPRPTPAVRWAHGLLLLQMVPFGYHLVPQNAEIRTLTGQLFAFGLFYYLALHPLLGSARWRPLVGESPRAYTAVLLLSLPLVQVAVRFGGAWTAQLLAWSGVVGLTAYTALAGANLAVLSALVWPRLRREVAGDRE
jgi:uncharacterized membrane protein